MSTFSVHLVTHVQSCCWRFFCVIHAGKVAFFLSRRGVVPASFFNLGAFPLAFTSTVGTGVRDARVIDQAPGEEWSASSWNYVWPWCAYAWGLGIQSGKRRSPALFRGGLKAAFAVSICPGHFAEPRYCLPPRPDSCVVYIKFNVHYTTYSRGCLGVNSITTL